MDQGHVAPQSVADVVVDPGYEVRDLCVDPRVSWLCTANTPGHDPRQLVPAHEGSSRVPLTRVLASFLQSSAQHRVSDLVHDVSNAAVVVRHHRDLDFLQDFPHTSPLAGRSPARHGAQPPGLVLLPLHWQGQRVYVGAGEVGGAFQLQQTDVILLGPAVVLLVHRHSLHTE